MKLSLKRLQILGFVFSVVVGTFLHFLYVWSGEKTVFAPISAVNESTFEHMKILFFPLFVFAIIEFFFVGKDHNNYWCIKLGGILIGTILIPVLFYTYTGVFGMSIDLINISIFFISSAVAFIVETILFKSGREICFLPILAFVFLCAIATLFIIFTFAPPHIPIFKDPITREYGI